MILSGSSSRPMITALVGALCFCLALAACNPGSRSPTENLSENISDVESLANEYLQASLERHPELGTYYALDDTRHDRLYDNSPEALLAWQSREDEWLERLRTIPEPEDVGSRDWISFGILKELLESAVATRVCRSELWSASGTTGWHRDLPFIFEVQPVDSAELRVQALRRLQQVDTYIDTEIANLRRGLEMGYSAPRVTAEKVPSEVRSLVADDSIFLSPAERSDDEGFANEVRAIYDAEIVPAIERFATFMETTYLPEAREEIALSANPGGAQCYPTLVRYFSTLQISADEIYRLGLEQVDDIQAGYRRVIDANFGGVPTADFLRLISSDPEFTFETEDDVLQYNVAGLDRAKSAMEQVVSHLPAADVVVRPYPEFAESGIGEYRAPSEDGTRPGVYFLAVTEPTKRTRAWQLSTLYHETYPGHHLQQAIALELGDRVHPIARYFGNSGFTEGWALYAERMADELGLFREPLDYIGLYSDQGARAARLVIDTGLHTRDWTRQQAVDYMLANTSWSEIDIENDIDRYISWPGQATAYMLGMLEIRRLRRLAESELGEAFDLRAFNDRVIGFGGITLPMLDASIRAWVEDRGAAAAHAVP